jgi:sodium/bile acid cotransporter 7
MAPGPGQAIGRHIGSLIVVVLFLMSLTLPLSRLARAAANGRAILVCSAVSYLVVPGLLALAAWFFGAGDEGTMAGLMILAALPVTLASAAVWTRSAGGNDAVPMVFTALTNGLTFLILPAMLSASLSRVVTVDPMAMASQLLTRILIPIAGGQILRALFPGPAERVRNAVSLIAKLLVLAIVLVAASGAAEVIRGDPSSTALIFLLCAVVHVLALLVAGRACRILKLNQEDTVGVLFAGTQKSLYVGVYVAAVFFADLPAALLPLLAYHVTQLAIDTLVAERVRVGR